MQVMIPLAPRCISLDCNLRGHHIRAIAESLGTFAVVVRVEQDWKIGEIEDCR
jgi:hypothetical protein